MRRRRWWILSAVAAVALAGCGSSPRSSGGSAAGTAQSATTTRSPSTTQSPTATISTAATPPTSTTSSTTKSTTVTGARMAECASSGLAGSVGSGSGAAGTSYYQLKLRNTSSTACYEQGYAGVSLLDPAGHQIGAAADRVPASAPKVVLAPGKTAYATLAVAEAGNYPSSCSIKASVELRVYPPDQTAPLMIPFHSQGCANSAVKLLHIKPFTATPSP